MCPPHTPQRTTGLLTSGSSSQHKLIILRSSRRVFPALSACCEAAKSRGSAHPHLLKTRPGESSTSLPRHPGLSQRRENPFLEEGRRFSSIPLGFWSYLYKCVFVTHLQSCGELAGTPTFRVYLEADVPCARRDAGLTPPSANGTRIGVCGGSDSVVFPGDFLRGSFWGLASPFPSDGKIQAVTENFLHNLHKVRLALVLQRFLEHCFISWCDR